MPDLDKDNISKLLDEYKKISNDPQRNKGYEYGLFLNEDVQADVFQNARVGMTDEKIKVFIKNATDYEEGIKKDVDGIVANFNNDFEQAIDSIKKGKKYIGYTASDIVGGVMIKVLENHGLNQSNSKQVKYQQARFQMNEKMDKMNEKMDEKMDKEERKQARGAIRSFGHKVLKIVGLSSSDSNRPNFAKQGGDSPEKGPKNG